MAPSSPSVAPPQATARRRAVDAARPAAPAATPRPSLRRWSTAGLLLVAAILVAAYVANAIAVNGLVAGIASLQKERDIVRAENDRQRAELLRLMSVERITQIAESRIGLVQPTMPPIALSPSTPYVVGNGRSHGGAHESRSQR